MRYFVVRLLMAFFSILDITMLVRAVLSWFPSGRTSKIYSFVYSITEPFIYPVRWVFDKITGGSSLPIDIPFLITYILISIIDSLLGTLL